MSCRALTFTGTIPAEPPHRRPPPDPAAGPDPEAMPVAGAAGAERFVDADGAAPSPPSQPKPAP